MFRKFNIVLVFTIIILSLPLSSCSMVRGATDWVWGLGEKMPSFGEKCTNGWFCFSGGKKKNTAQQQYYQQQGMIQKRKPSANANMPTRRASMPHHNNYAPPVRQQPQQRNYGGQQPTYGQPMYAPPYQGGMPPHAGIPGGNYQPQAGGMPPNMMVPNNDLSPQDAARMKPWEVNPEWKRDLPQTPLDGIEKSIGW